jgi:hypothetical protein
MTQSPQRSSPWLVRRVRGGVAAGDGAFLERVAGRGGVSLEGVRVFITAMSRWQRDVSSVTSACGSRAAETCFIIALFAVHLVLWLACLR